MNATSLWAFKLTVEQPRGVRSAYGTALRAVGSPWVSCSRLSASIPRYSIKAAVSSELETGKSLKNMERETGIEPATSSLGSWPGAPFMEVLTAKSG